jgi:predicted nucleotidyltransferase
MQPALPDHLAPAVRAALDEAASAVRALYGERLHALVLFGSQARGTAHDESDVDVLVVLDDGFRVYDEIKRVGGIQIGALDRHGVLLSLIPMERTRYEDPGHPLMMNVNDEGVVL